MERQRKLENAVTQAASWTLGGALGGMTFHLVQSDLSSTSPDYWLIISILFIMAVGSAYLVNTLIGGSNSTKSELKEMRKEISAIHDELSKMESATGSSSTEELDEKSD